MLTVIAFLLTLIAVTLIYGKETSQTIIKWILLASTSLVALGLFIGLYTLAYEYLAKIGWSKIFQNVILGTGAVITAILLHYIPQKLKERFPIFERNIITGRQLVALIVLLIALSISGAVVFNLKDFS